MVIYTNLKNENYIISKNLVFYMCGIFMLLNNPSNMNKSSSLVYKSFMKGKGRGPEHSVLTEFLMSVPIGFHRLAINGLNDGANPPLIVNGVQLICNGEIYNYKELYESLQIKPSTDSDCEVIIHLYLKFGIEKALQMLDGVFAFALQDGNNLDFPIYLARDPYGVRPLYEFQIHPVNLNDKSIMYGFASEMKSLIDIMTYQRNYTNHNIVQFEPGTYSEFIFPQKVCSPCKKTISNKRYTMLPFVNQMKHSEEHISQLIRTTLLNAVEKRVKTTERPIACLLSGGLDSSLITALVAKFYDSEKNGKLKTFSIGLPGSEDLKYAQEVADYIGTDHTNIVVQEEDFLAAIPKVIYAVESYDTTTIRASTGNYLISKYISENCDAKVIFNGDGADEVMGGYLYFHKSPNEFEFDFECRRLVSQIHYFDVQRSDRSISSHGLEPRTPFLDRAFVQMYLSLPTNKRCFNLPENKGQCEKYLIRKAFDHVFDGDKQPVLPHSVLWRRKEAFSDGVSSKKRGWYEIIQEHVEQFGKDYNDFKLLALPDEKKPITKEQLYYYKIFQQHFPNCDRVFPYYWMPKFVEATDSSARTLELYNEDNE